MLSPAHDSSSKSSPSSTKCWLLSGCVIVVLCGCTRATGPTTETVAAPSDKDEPSSVEKAEVREQTDAMLQSSLRGGEKLFNAYCAACHQLGGQGVEGRVPPLDNSPWVAGSENRLVRIVLNGLRGPIEINGELYNLEMPAFRPLFKDDDVASILTYVRQRYGAPSPPVTTKTVARLRQETDDRKRYWTVEELLRLP